MSLGWLTCSRSDVCVCSLSLPLSLYISLLPSFSLSHAHYLSTFRSPVRRPSVDRTDPTALCCIWLSVETPKRSRTALATTSARRARPTFSLPSFQPFTYSPVHSQATHRERAKGTGRGAPAAAAAAAAAATTIAHAPVLRPVHLSHPVVLSGSERPPPP